MDKNECCSIFESVLQSVNGIQQAAMHGSNNIRMARHLKDTAFDTTSNASTDAILLPRLIAKKKNSYDRSLIELFMNQYQLW